MKKSFFPLSICCLYIFFIFCAHASIIKASYLLKQADRCRKSLYRSKKQKKYRVNWLRCIYKYRKIYRLYPASPEAPWAIYHSANLYLHLYRYSRKKQDLEKSLNLFRWLTEKYPSHRLADDAQFKIAWIYYKYKHDLQKAYVEFLKVEIRYPKGDMRVRAKRFLDRIAVVLSKNDTERLRKSIKKRMVAVKDIRYWATSDYTRVVVDLEAKVKYSSRLDPKKGFVINIKNAFIPYNKLIHRSVKKGDVKDIVARQYKDGIVKVCISLKDKKINSYDIFHLYNPYRIVVDIGEKKRSQKITKNQAKKIKKRRVRKGIRKVKKKDNTISLARQLGLGVRRIVIDPGHGGRDPGCIWGRIKEKDITLRIAKILAKKLRSMGYEVYLTRTKDIYLPLEKRTAIANLRKADLFISIHVNAHRNRRIRGVETYFLNMATDERAILVAARENATSEKNISDLQSIISELMLNTKIHESSKLAYDVQEGIINTLKKRYRYIQNLGVKQGPFYVLVGARMPAVLIEVGYITNWLERKRLLSKRYKQMLATGIAKGIQKYIEEIQNIASATY